WDVLSVARTCHPDAGLGPISEYTPTPDSCFLDRVRPAARDRSAQVASDPRASLSLTFSSCGHRYLAGHTAARHRPGAPGEARARATSPGKLRSGPRPEKDGLSCPQTPTTPF